VSRTAGRGSRKGDSFYAWCISGEVTEDGKGNGLRFSLHNYKREEDAVRGVAYDLGVDR
jgi:hypothetical protein